MSLRFKILALLLIIVGGLLFATGMFVWADGSSVINNLKPGVNLWSLHETLQTLVLSGQDLTELLFMSNLAIIGTWILIVALMFLMLSFVVKGSDKRLKKIIDNTENKEL